MAPPAQATVRQDFAILYCIGAQKTGTSSLYRSISRRPEIYFRRKEIHYWDVIRPPYIAWDSMWHVEQSASARKRNADVETGAIPVAGPARAREAMFRTPPDDHRAYLEYIAPRRVEQRIAADFSPSYALCNAETFAEMLGLADDVRFIFIMRDPVTRLWSGVRKRMREFLTEDRSGALAVRTFARSLEDPYDPDLRRSRYEVTLAALERHVPDERCLFLFFETLFTSDAMQRIADFARLDGAPSLDLGNVNPGVTPSLVPDAALLARARDVLDPTYHAVRQRFGAQVPATWTE